MGLTSRHAAASLSGALKCALFYVRVLSSLNLSLNLIHLSKLRGAASFMGGLQYTELVRSNPATRGSTEQLSVSVRAHDSHTFESFWISFWTAVVVVFRWKRHPEAPCNA